MNLELVAVGLIVGVLVGLTGVGGGSIMTPLLIAFGIPPLTAVGSDLLYNAPMKVFAAFLHHRQGNVNWRVVKYLCIGGVPAGGGGALLFAWLRTHADMALLQSFTRHAVGVVILAAAVIVVLTPWLMRSRPTAVTMEWGPKLRLRVIAIGALVGLIVTVTSVGSGAVTLPLLAITLPLLGIGELIGSDIVYSAILIPTALLGRLSTGDVNFPLTFNLIAGSLPGVFLGARLCKYLQPQYLRPAVALTLVVVGARMAL